MINEAFEIHSKLNPKLWDPSTNKLLPEVKTKLLEIVEAFEDYLKAPLQICDVQVVGSNAGYNYTKDSDLDVHIIANFDIISDNTEILHSLYDTKKSQFNKNYDITIRGIDVELFIQDVKSGIVSNGVYSVLDDEWVKKPKVIKKVTTHNVEEEFNKWKRKIEKVVENNNPEEINDAISTLYLVRTNSITADGEYGAGNQLFKELRAAGLLQQLKDALVTAQTKKLSLENLKEKLEDTNIFKGRFISNYED